MPLDQLQVASLVTKLPDLQADLFRDQQWQSDSDLHAYLDFYHLPKTSEYPGIQHLLGVIPCGDLRIATHYWLPENPKGTLLIMHGYYDHTGLFGNAIRLALQENFAVLIFDLPGHGLSSGEKITIDSFDHYADVLNQVLQYCRDWLPQPLHAWGQSTGCAVLLNHLWRYPDSSLSIAIHKRILFAPLILPRDWLTKGRWVYWFVHKFVSRIGRKKSDNTHDKNFIHFVDYLDPLQTRYLSVAWVGAMKAWAEQVKQFESLDTKVLIVQGTADRTVDWRYNLGELKRLLPNAQIELIPDARHQLINETPEYRQPVFNLVKDYLSSSN